MKKTIWASLLSVALSTLLLLPLAAAQENIKLEFLAVNDLRGAIRAENNAPGIAKLGAVIRNKRAFNPLGVVLVGGGNMLFGTLESNSNDGFAIIKAMNTLDFDANVVGTHFFDFKPQILAEQVKAAHFPYVTSNVVAREGADFFKPYTLLERKGVKIGVIGVTTTSTLHEAKQENLQQFIFTDPYLSAQKAIDAARKQGAQLIVALLHCKVEQRDYDASVRGEAVRILSYLKGVDICFTGDSSMVVNGEFKGIPVLQGGVNGQYLAQVAVEYDPAQKKVVSKVGSLLNVAESTLTPDLELELQVQPLLKTIDNEFGAQLAQNQQALTNDKFEQSSLAEYLTDHMRSAFQADIALLNGGNIKAGIPAGPVTARQVELAYPTEDELVTMELSGAKLLEALDFGVDNQSAGQGRFSGIRLAVEPDMPRGRRIIDNVLPDGTKVDTQKMYKVVTSGFLAKGGAGYSMLLAGTDKQVVATSIKSFFRQVFRQAGTIDYSSDKRWSVGNLR